MSIDSFYFMSEQLLSMPEYASQILVNGVATTGMAMRAEESRVHQFLDDNEWKFASYEIYLPSEVLNSPWNLNEQSEIKLVVTGMKLAIRALDPPSGPNKVGFVYVFGVCLPR